MFSLSEEPEKYKEILMPDLSRVTPLSSAEVQAQIRDYIQRQPKSTQFEFIVEPVRDQPNIQAFAITKHVAYLRYEEPTIVIQDYLHQEARAQRTKIVATVGIAMSYWLTSFFRYRFAVGCRLNCSAYIMVRNPI